MMGHCHTKVESDLYKAYRTEGNKSTTDALNGSYFPPEVCSSRILRDHESCGNTHCIFRICTCSFMQDDEYLGTLDTQGATRIGSPFCDSDGAIESKAIMNDPQQEGLLLSPFHDRHPCSARMKGLVSVDRAATHALVRRERGYQHSSALSQVLRCRNRAVR